MPVRISAFYIALHAALLMALALWVMFQRDRHKLRFGDAGEKDMMKAVRAHGNAAEYIPIALLLLMAFELNGGGPTMLHACGAGLFASRLLHAWGIIKGRGGRPLSRLVGIIGTLLVIFVLIWANLRLAF
jgi:uncharacterized membrane protein YecN with MAPEG domain